MSIINQIHKFYKNKKSLLFTTPSHSLGNFIIPELKNLLGKKFFKNDFSEIEGFDNLRNPKGAIKELQEKIAQIYNTKASFILTNGSTSGIIAAMLATLKPNDNVLIARNCHISVYNGLVLTGAIPIWFLPKFNENWGIFDGVKASDIENEINNNKNIKALIITSPTYEGNFSDIENISKLCKANNIKLIVDEAHGALHNFGDFKSKPAIQLGADITIQSLHKTAGAPNPCALLHISENIDKNKIQNALNLLNTTSPSYPLIAAAEAAVSYLSSPSGHKHITMLQKLINEFKNKLHSNIEIYENNNDTTKILLRFKNISSLDAAEILNEKYDIEEEHTNSQSLLFLTGIGTDASKLKKLAKALNKIAKLNQNKNCTKNFEYKIPQMVYSPKEAYFKESSIIAKDQSLGKISAAVLVPYPPGIPVLLPGEIITEDTLPYINQDEVSILNKN